jgi:hypothetical protein
MPVTPIDATPESATANAYVTLAEADQYHLDRPPVGTTWASATSDQKTAAILWATKLLDNLFVWNGFVTTIEQALLWPRIGLYMPNEVTPVDMHTIPDALKDATAEFARQLLAADRTGDSALQTLGIKLVKTGSIRVDFKDDIFRKPVPDVVIDLIPPDWGYLYDNPEAGQRELQRA